MKNIIYILTLLLAAWNAASAQCSLYQVYESFGSTSLPTQGGTWTHNSVITVTSPVRTGTRAIGFNATGDWIRTPIISTPGIFSFYYRRSSNTAAWSCAIETSPDGTTWTSRGTISAITASYQQYAINLGALGLTNVYVRVRDARASGSHERYIDDMSWTSTSSSENLLLPSLSSCSRSIPSGTTYTYTDHGGPSDTYNNSSGQTITFSPATSGEKVEISFSSLAGELGSSGTLYDYIEIFDGPTTASPLLGTWTSTPSGAITSSAAGGELTVRFASDISYAYDGWTATVYTIGIPLPVTMGYFGGREIDRRNRIEWTTYSEHSSDYFTLETSTDGIYWFQIGNIIAAGNSIQQTSYFYDHQFTCLCYNYYRLKQVDFDGNYEYFGPISIDNSVYIKKIARLTDLMGREIPMDSRGMVIEIYEDGTSHIGIR